MLPPIVAVRVRIGTVPEDEARQVRLFRKLLEYNATDLMHISYGVDGDTVVLSGALELENLDLNELEAVLSDIDLALARHVPVAERGRRELGPRCGLSPCGTLGRDGGTPSTPGACRDDSRGVTSSRSGRA